MEIASLVLSSLSCLGIIFIVLLIGGLAKIIKENHLVVLGLMVILYNLNPMVETMDVEGLLEKIDTL
jgi:hypothetical protein